MRTFDNETTGGQLRLATGLGRSSIDCMAGATIFGGAEKVRYLSTPAMPEHKLRKPVDARRAHSKRRKMLAVSIAVAAGLAGLLTFLLAGCGGGGTNTCSSASDDASGGDVDGQRGGQYRACGGRGYFTDDRSDCGGGPRGKCAGAVPQTGCSGDGDGKFQPAGEQQRRGGGTGAHGSILQ